MCVHSVLGAKRIARQYWRAWIETISPLLDLMPCRASPASIGGRGLKHQGTPMKVCPPPHRPPVLAGVD